jgi:hypothetical protein
MSQYPQDNLNTDGGKRRCPMRNLLTKPMQEFRNHPWSIHLIAATVLLLSAFTENSLLAADQSIVVNGSAADMNQSVFEEIAGMAKGKASGEVDLGIGAIFSYLHQPRETTVAQIKTFLSLSERFDIPIVVQLDGEQWWGNRPDLWNWWDPTSPGYNPDNRNNVEWSGWGPEHAIKIAWRNWGRQIRVLPPPNFMSKRYRDACHDEMKVLVPLVLKWWQGLPEEKKHLLIGIKLGWESSIGVNSFHYPDGNVLLDKPEAEDPKTGIKSDQIPSRGVAAIGYAAVTTAELANHGDLQEAHLAQVISMHLADLCALSAKLGVPRDKLFTHVGAWKEGELLYDAALNPNSCPGWSFYQHASDPAKDTGVQQVLRKSDAPHWAAVEWLVSGDEPTWRKSIERTLLDPKCRYLCIYNWSGIKSNRAAISAIEGFLASGKSE